MPHHETEVHSINTPGFHFSFSTPTPVPAAHDPQHIPHHPVHPTSPVPVLPPLAPLVPLEPVVPYEPYEPLPAVEPTSFYGAPGPEPDPFAPSPVDPILPLDPLDPLNPPYEPLKIGPTAVPVTTPVPPPVTPNPVSNLASIFLTRTTPTPVHPDPSVGPIHFLGSTRAPHINPEPANRFRIFRPSFGKSPAPVAPEIPVGPDPALFPEQAHSAALTPLGSPDIALLPETPLAPVLQHTADITDTANVIGSTPSPLVPLTVSPFPHFAPASNNAFESLRTSQTGTEEPKEEQRTQNNRNPTRNLLRNPTRNPIRNPTRNPTRIPSTTITRNQSGRQVIRTRGRARSTTPKPTVSSTTTPTSSTPEPTRFNPRDLMSTTNRPLTTLETEPPSFVPKSRRPPLFTSDDIDYDYNGEETTIAPFDFVPTRAPSRGPTRGRSRGGATFAPAASTNQPTRGPTNGPTRGPTNGPTRGPINEQTRGPTTIGSTSGPSNGPTRGPTSRPFNGPTRGPITTLGPINGPTRGPSRGTTIGPTITTIGPNEFVPTAPPINARRPPFAPTVKPNQNEVLDEQSRRPTKEFFPTRRPFNKVTFPRQGKTGDKESPIIIKQSDDHEDILFKNLTKPKTQIDDFEIAFDIDFNGIERAQVTEVPKQSNLVVDPANFSEDEDKPGQLFGQFEDIFQKEQELELEQLDVEESKRDSGYPHQRNPYSQVRYDDYEAPVHSLPAVNHHHTIPHPTKPTAYDYNHVAHPKPPPHHPSPNFIHHSEHNHLKHHPGHQDPPEGKSKYYVYNHVEGVDATYSHGSQGFGHVHPVTPSPIFHSTPSPIHHEVHHNPDPPIITPHPAHVPVSHPGHPDPHHPPPALVHSTLAPTHHPVTPVPIHHTTGVPQLPPIVTNGPPIHHHSTVASAHHHEAHHHEVHPVTPGPIFHSTHPTVHHGSIFHSSTPTPVHHEVHHHPDSNYGPPHEVHHELPPVEHHPHHEVTPIPAIAITAHPDPHVPNNPNMPFRPVFSTLKPHAEHLPPIITHSTLPPIHEEPIQPVAPVTALPALVHSTTGPPDHPVTHQHVPIFHTTGPPVPAPFSPVTEVPEHEIAHPPHSIFGAKIVQPEHHVEEVVLQPVHHEPLPAIAPVNGYGGPDHIPALPLDHEAPSLAEILESRGPPPIEQTYHEPPPEHHYGPPPNDVLVHHEPVDHYGHPPPIEHHAHHEPHHPPHHKSIFDDPPPAVVHHESHHPPIEHHPIHHDPHHPEHHYGPPHEEHHVHHEPHHPEPHYGPPHEDHHVHIEHHHPEPHYGPPHEDHHVHHELHHPEHHYGPPHEEHHFPVTKLPAAIPVENHLHHGPPSPVVEHHVHADHLTIEHHVHHDPHHGDQYGPPPPPPPVEHNLHHGYGPPPHHEVHPEHHILDHPVTPIPQPVENHFIEHHDHPVDHYGPPPHHDHPVDHYGPPPAPFPHEAYPEDFYDPEVDYYAQPPAPYLPEVYSPVVYPKAFPKLKPQTFGSPLSINVALGEHGSPIYVSTPAPYLFSTRRTPPTTTTFPTRPPPPPIGAIGPPPELGPKPPPPPPPPPIPVPAVPHPLGIEHGGVIGVTPAPDIIPVASPTPIVPEYQPAIQFSTPDPFFGGTILPDEVTTFPGTVPAVPGLPVTPSAKLIEQPAAPVIGGVHPPLNGPPPPPEIGGAPPPLGGPPPHTLPHEVPPPEVPHPEVPHPEVPHPPVPNQPIYLLIDNHDGYGPQLVPINAGGYGPTQSSALLDALLKGQRPYKPTSRPARPKLTKPPRPTTTTTTTEATVPEYTRNEVPEYNNEISESIATPIPNEALDLKKIQEATRSQLSTPFSIFNSLGVNTVSDGIRATVTPIPNDVFETTTFTPTLFGDIQQPFRPSFSGSQFKSIFDDPLTTTDTPTTDTSAPNTPSTGTASIIKIEQFGNDREPEFKTSEAVIPKNLINDKGKLQETILDMLAENLDHPFKDSVVSKIKQQIQESDRTLIDSDRNLVQLGPHVVMTVSKPDQAKKVEAEIHRTYEGQEFVGLQNLGNYLL